jgi:alkylation response protein AidB-like acyl-CoA dehydrogenase
MNEIARKDQFQAAPPSSADSPQLLQLLSKVEDGASQREYDRTLPFETIDLIRKARLGALRLYKTDGGSDVSIRELFRIIIRLGSADANVAHILRNHFGVVELFARNPLNERSRQWQRAVASGAIIGLANTELGTSKAGGVLGTTTLSTDGDGYRLNGTKYYSTGTLYADYVLVRAADQNGNGLVALIPTDRKGIERLDDWDGIGQRLTGSGTTHFHNVPVEADEVIFDTPTTGYGIAYSNTFAQLYLTSINAGIIDAILRDAKSLVIRRHRNFYHAPAERPSDDPLIQQTIGQISSNAFAAESIVLAAATPLNLMQGKKIEASFRRSWEQTRHLPQPKRRSWLTSWH